MPDPTPPTAADLRAKLFPPSPAAPRRPRSDLGKRRVKEGVAAPPPRPTLDSFLDHFSACAGGPAKLAKLMFDEFLAAPPGSLVRGRIMEAFLRSLKAAEMRGKAAEDLGNLSDEDLQKLLDERLEALATEADDDGPAAAG